MERQKAEPSLQYDVLNIIAVIHYTVCLYNNQGDFVDFYYKAFWLVEGASVCIYLLAVLFSLRRPSDEELQHANTYTQPHTFILIKALRIILIYALVANGVIWLSVLIFVNVSIRCVLDSHLVIKIYSKKINQAEGRD